MTDPSSRLGEIKASSERGSAWWLDPIADARWLLEHVEQLQARVDDVTADSLLTEAQDEITDLRSQVERLQRVGPPASQVRCNPPGDSPCWGRVLEAPLGADDDR